MSSNGVSLNPYAPAKDCPECGEKLHAATRLCDCGYEFPRKDKEYPNLNRLVNMGADKDEARSETVADCLPGGLSISACTNWVQITGFTAPHASVTTTASPSRRQICAS